MTWIKVNELKSRLNSRFGGGDGSVDGCGYNVGSDGGVMETVMNTFSKDDAYDFYADDCKKMQGWDDDCQAFQ